MITRRSLLTGITAFLAAPAIVRASSIMPVKAVPQSITLTAGTWDIGGSVDGTAIRWVAVDGSGDYYTLGAAMYDAKPGDTIMLTRGIYDANGIRVNKLTAIF